MPYVKGDRNYEGVRFQKIREEIDEFFGKLHDDISEAYYDNIEFVWEGTNYGVPNEELFNDFHKFSNEARQLAFHFVNKKLEDDPEETKYNEDDYRYDSTRDNEGNIVDTKDKVQEAYDYIGKIFDKYPDFDMTIQHSKYGEYSLRELYNQVSL